MPIAHWLWGNGWLIKLGLLDFAGGTVVPVSAGVSGLVAAGGLVTAASTSRPTTCRWR